MIVDPPPGIVCILVGILSRGAIRNNKLCLGRQLRLSIGVFFDDKPTIWCNNSSAMAVVANPVLHSRFKHVELDLFFVREKVADGSLVVGEVPASDQVVDILTKPLSSFHFCRFRQLLRVSML
ncbi:shikimate O-hydroxycinnamoyltransferase-like [Gossypium australe]|uniref:Shikimate O-hydroxycinnamoyltransferase-like n=1 Tax=Gossypium australe TaxID=47621 RepID=A0A5B6V179_9ROSI|nr:shikimate O-hydroxycinnamoyltransferase-like [Gossypium australe]